MILFYDLVARAQKEFPDLQIKFKNESTFMKILGTILFFNPSFMNSYITTIGSTIYFQNRDYINSYPKDAAIVLLHELVHIYDSKKENKLLFSFLYLIPQIFVLLTIPLLILFGWKIALFGLLFLLPFPAYFRMKDERKAYTISLYVSNKLNREHIDFDKEKEFYVNQFKGSSYYFMYPFKSINTYFDDVVLQLKSSGRSNAIEPELYDIIDKVLSG